ncbi:hypothetical protein N8I77_008571 [Diaporthe amygdali]|uniref:Uncharacterized protein n=1 Tax=Phomopsis amygdali TaxID=1214568 RepID=A0AAD9SDZ0_PHOAM|nr:hypothetical protein N8I77_008571 [Diaporthe amygdali]
MQQTQEPATPRRARAYRAYRGRHAGFRPALMLQNHQQLAAAPPPAPVPGPGPGPGPAQEQHQNQTQSDAGQPAQAVVFHGALDEFHNPDPDLGALGPFAYPSFPFLFSVTQEEEEMQQWQVGPMPGNYAQAYQQPNSTNHPDGFK